MNARTRFVSLLLILAFAGVAALVRTYAQPEAVSRLVHQRQMKQVEVQRRFDQAVVMLHARQYEHALTALHRVLELAPRMPEAHVNMGYALLGLERPDAAGTFFQTAIELKPDQANAYYGLALAAEARDDYAMALGSMRAYLHLSPAEDEGHRRKARAAMWEWEEKLGRHVTPAAAASAAAASADAARPAGSAAAHPLAAAPAPAQPRQ